MNNILSPYGQKPVNKYQPEPYYPQAAQAYTEAVAKTCSEVYICFSMYDNFPIVEMVTDDIEKAKQWVADMIEVEDSDFESLNLDPATSTPYDICEALDFETEDYGFYFHKYEVR